MCIRDRDCFVYRTIEDLNAIESCARRSKRGAVVGGGLLGLEAAGALKNLGVETHVIEFAPMLMAEQLDQMGGEQLRRKIESMGVKVHTSKNTKEIVQQGIEARKTMRFADVYKRQLILPPQRREARLRLLGSQRNQWHRYAFEATAGLKIAITCLFPESGFLLIGEWTHRRPLIVPCVPQV